MSLDNKNKSLHIVMFPWLGLTHGISFIRLANKLAEKGHKVSFIHPTKNLAKLSPHNLQPDMITFIPLDLDEVSVMFDTTEEDMLQEAKAALLNAMDLSQDIVESHLARLRPDLVFFDFAQWLPKLARKHGAKSLYYAASDLVCYAFSCLVPKDRTPTLEDLTGPLPGFPNPDIRLRVHEVMVMASQVDVLVSQEGMSFNQRIDISFKECDAIACMTCREIEGPFCDLVGSNLGKPVLLAGPVIPSLLPTDSILSERFDTWLKGFSKGSVVFCVLGSGSVLKKDQFQELVLGLELTGRPFLAVLKPPKECGTIESALPEGFAERTKGRGIVSGDWVQQQLILQHPSAGCFITHCGASSFSEAILSECQLVLLPQALDQFINARMMSMELKVGVEVEKREEDGFFTKEDFSKAVSTVMDEESEVGKNVRANHAKWRKLFLREGFGDSYINEFIQSLRGLIE